MLLTISTTHRPATDLGYLLAKNPARTQRFSLSFGEAHVFYPQASDHECTAALMLDIDPIGLSRKNHATTTAPLLPYVNDRPYVSCSLMSVALSRVFGSALNGTSRDRPELVHTPIPLTAALPVVPGRPALIRRLFEPLGYEVTVDALPMPSLDGRPLEVHYASLHLEATATLSQLLQHLYVLIPVLDAQKHYYVGRDELQKLLDKGADWLRAHPEKEMIVNRYLKRIRKLTRDALVRLSDTDTPDADEADDAGDAAEEAVEAPVRLNTQRIDAVVGGLVASGASRVLDLGAGSGKITRALLKAKRGSEAAFDQVTSLEVSLRAIEAAERRLKLDRMSDRERARIQVLHGSLCYRDDRLKGYDAAALVEVIEHVDESRLPAIEGVVFGHAKPRTVLVTTPNIEFNARFEMPDGQLRHPDHRFEWTRAEFQAWAHRVGETHGYTVQFQGIGPVDEAVGAPTQMATFERGVDRSDTSVRNQ